MPAIVILGGLLVWLLASSIGLLWYKRWARFGVWASAIGIYAGLLIIDGYRPRYTSSVGDILAMVDSMLIGAIVLLAYARNYGAAWFAVAPLNRQEK